MSRRPNIEMSLRLNLSLPESERGWLDAYLFSEAEQRVPKGAYQQFFLDRLREFRERLVAGKPPAQQRTDESVYSRATEGTSRTPPEGD